MIPRNPVSEVTKQVNFKLIEVLGINICTMQRAFLRNYETSPKQYIFGFNIVFGTYYLQIPSFKLKKLGNGDYGIAQRQFRLFLICLFNTNIGGFKLDKTVRTEHFWVNLLSRRWPLIQNKFEVPKLLETII